MLIVISPAKTLDFEQALPAYPCSAPQFQAEANALAAQLRDFSADELCALMSISPALGELNSQRFRQWRDKPATAQTRPAVMAFMGDVYEGLQARDFAQEDLHFAQGHLRILSGLYGLLRPLDAIQPYRLEMGTGLRNEHGANLYRYWGGSVTQAINSQLHEAGSRTLINLASQEYFKVLQPAKIEAEIISPEFRDWQRDEYRIVSFYAKRARGLMSRFIVNQRLTEPDALKSFDAEGYRYDAASSTAQRWVFLRDARA